MSKQILQIVDFTAGVDDRRRGLGVHLMHLVDIHSIPGVVGVQPKPTQLTYSGQAPQAFEIYDENGGTPSLFVQDDSFDFHQLSGTTFTSVYAPAGGSDGGFTMKRFKTGLYFMSVDNSGSMDLGRLVGDASTPANWDSSVQSWSGDFARFTDDQLCPMEVFLNSLYIANGHYVSKLESDELTFTAAALTVDTEAFIQASCIFQDYLVLGTRSGSSSQKEYVYFWDGVSDYVSYKIEVPKPGVSALFSYNKVLYAWVEDKIYIYTGNVFEVALIIPGVSDGAYSAVDPLTLANAVVLYKDKMLFGSGGTGWSDSGVYQIGNRTMGEPLALSYAYDRAGTETKITTLGIFQSSSTVGSGTLYIGFSNSTIYKVDESMDVYTTEAYLVTDVYDLNVERGRLISGFKILPVGYSGQAQGGDNEWTVYYRIDRDTNNLDVSDGNFTLLGTINDSNAEQILYGIYKRCRKIQFKIKFVTSGDRQDSRMYGFELY